MSLYSYRNSHRGTGARLRPRRGLKRLWALATPVFIFSLAAASICLLVNDAISAPPSLEVGARIFTEGLNIELDRTSPAYAALEDTWGEDPGVDEPFIPENLRPVATIQIAAGEQLADVPERILRENRREQALLAREKSAREAQAQALAAAVGQVFKKMAPPETEVPTTTKTISLSELKISRDELLRAFFAPIVNLQKTIPAGPPVVMAQHKREPVVLGADPRPRVKIDQYRQVFISGPIEFHGGLAMTNAQDRVVVYRERDGEALEAGAVWIREGRYEIFVEDTEGVLLGELRTTYGDILGRGIFDLASLPANTDSPRRIDPIPLRIQPVAQGIVGHVLAKRTPGKSRVLAGAAVEFKGLPLGVTTRNQGRFEQPHFLEGSSVIVKASRMGYWGTMAFATAGTESNLEILPDQPGQVLQSLLSVSRASAKDRPAAIIWGQVSRGGRPVTGASVELMTSDENLQPIYFNSAMLPDPGLRVTSSNGLYAFYPVNPGAHAVQAHVADVTTEAAIFPADERTVSRVDLEVASDRPAKVRVFDAFRTDWPLAAVVSDPSRSRQVVIDRTGESKMKYATGSGPLILDVDAGRGYQVTRITSDRGRRSIYAPMIQTSWFDQARNSLRLNPVPHAGTVVGFVQGAPAYRVVVERAISDQSKIVYFNSRGDLTGKDYGESGGGFMILNLTEGFRAVTIQPSGTTKVYSTTLLVDPNVTNVITHSVR